MPSVPRFLRLFAVLPALLLFMVGCSDDNDEPSTTGSVTTQPVQASPPAGRTDLPEEQITARDYAFDFKDEIQGGLVRLTLKNEGSEPHQAAVLRLNDGVTPQQLEASLSPDPD